MAWTRGSKAKNAAISSLVVPVSSCLPSRRPPASARCHAAGIPKAPRTGYIGGATLPGAGNGLGKLLVGGEELLGWDSPQGGGIQPAVQAEDLEEALGVVGRLRWVLRGEPPGAALGDDPADVRAGDR